MQYKRVTLDEYIRRNREHRAQRIVSVAKTPSQKLRLEMNENLQKTTLSSRQTDLSQIQNVGRQFYDYKNESDFYLSNLFDDEKNEQNLSVIESLNKDEKDSRIILPCSSEASESRSELESCKMNSSPSAKTPFMDRLNFEKIS